MRPSEAAIDPTASWTASRSEMSIGQWRTPHGVGGTSSGSNTATAAPAADSTRTIAAPMPRDPPVTMATRPCRSGTDDRIVESASIMSVSDRLSGPQKNGILYPCCQS